MVYVDPSGHDETWVLLGLIVGALVFAYDTSRRHGSDNYCTGSLSECFQNVELKKFTDNQVIDTGDFHNMLDTVNIDLHKKWRTTYDPARAGYDTPFYNGNDENNDKTVCVDNKCSPQSAVNYVAQGMYSAHTGQSLPDAKKLADRWNRYAHMFGSGGATEDELYWLEYGYNYYNTINKTTKTSGLSKTKSRVVHKEDEL